MTRLQELGRGDRGVGRPEAHRRSVEVRTLAAGRVRNILRERQLERARSVSPDEVRGTAGRYDPARVDERDVLVELLDLVQVMRRVDDGRSFVGEPPDQLQDLRTGTNVGARPR